MRDSYARGVAIQLQRCWPGCREGDNPHCIDQLLEKSAGWLECSVACRLTSDRLRLAAR
jgi:hypothetical protein